VTLIEATIEKDALTVDFQQVLRTRGCSGGTAESQFHVREGSGIQNLFP
jgi:hypothetical protein